MTSADFFHPSVGVFIFPIHYQAAHVALPTLVLVLPCQPSHDSDLIPKIHLHIDRYPPLQCWGCSGLVTMVTWLEQLSSLCLSRHYDVVKSGRAAHDPEAWVHHGID